LPEYLLLLLMTLAAMTVHAVVGFGFAQFLAPVLLLTRPAVETVSALLLLALFVNTLIVAEGAPPGFRRRGLAPVVPGALVGLTAGALLLHAIDGAAVQALVGVAILLTAALQLRRRRPNRCEDAPVARPAAGTVAGALSGVLTTTTAIGAAPVILWLERHADGPAQLRHAIALYSVLLCAVGAALLVVRDVREASAGVLLAVTLAPAVLGGHALGRRAYRRLSAGAYRRVVLGLVIVAGLGSIAGALA
jgi:uncharacterized membrane protein YfcA